MSINQGAKLKFLADRSGKTNADIARLSGIGEASLYNYFKEEEINSKKLKKICDAMGWKVEDFNKTLKDVEEEQAAYGLKAENEALKKEVELLRQQVAAKEEIIELLKHKTKAK